MMKKSEYIYPVLTVAALTGIWQLVCTLGIVPPFLLPSPVSIGNAAIADMPLLLEHAGVTLLESITGLILGVITGFLTAVIMDRFEAAYKAFYPIIVISQTIPTVAVAPLLVLWFGYEMLPKIILIILVTFFPITVGLLEGYRSCDTDTVKLLISMGADRGQIFRYVKFPASLDRFFAGLKISASYAIVGGVISEWLGGFRGLGVYMTRVKKAYAFDKMFAVIFIISFISLLLIKAVELLQRRSMPWKERK